MVTMSNKHLNAQYNLRWPDELKEKISQSAKEHNRSMNADIVARLEDSFSIIQQAKDSHQKLLESTLDLQSVFKENLEMQNKLIEQNKALADELRRLKNK